MKNLFETMDELEEQEDLVDLVRRRVEGGADFDEVYAILGHFHTQQIKTISMATGSQITTAAQPLSKVYSRLALYLDAIARDVSEVDELWN